MENVYHDFPLLAKQSGFYFQLHRGKVNWSEIENLDLNEIIENRNFYLLEQNLRNVVNFNLNEEYKLKVLDENLVKLFRLAQLGVNYLSYCQTYLDKCIVLLQEQVSNFKKKEFERLKRGKNKRQSILNRERKKNKTENYQCEKCEKIFISDVYLKCHDKRRHSNLDIPKSLERLTIKSTDQFQLIEVSKEEQSVSTQTEINTELQHYGENQSVIRIAKLEQELQELKEYLKTTEGLSKDRETSETNQLQSFSLSSPIHYNPLLMLLSSYLTTLTKDYYEINPEFLTFVKESCHSSDTVVTMDTEIYNSAKTESVVECKKQESPIAKTKPCSTNKHVKYAVKEVRNLGNDKENVDSSNKNLKPLPPQRKLKTVVQAQPITNIGKTKPLLEIAPETEEQIRDGRIYLHKNKSIELHKPDNENASEIFEQLEFNLKTSSREKLVLLESESNSFARNIVAKNSPNLQKLRKNIKKSLSGLYESVSFNEKEGNESEKKNLKATMVDEMNDRLRQLGVYSELFRIPERTMKQKLNALKYGRKLLSKENPMYPAIRRNLEEKIFRKVKKKIEKGTVVNNNLMIQGPTNSENPSPKPSASTEQVFEMYVTNFDSESYASEKFFDPSPEQNN